MQWNFWLSTHWSVFGEPGLVIFHGFFEDCPVQFNSLGENIKAIAFVFQWQSGKFVQVLPAGAAGSVPILYPKPNW